MMMIAGHIWEELGQLGTYIELINHDEGIVTFKETATQDERDAVAAVMAAHDPTPRPVVF